MVEKWGWNLLIAGSSPACHSDCKAARGPKPFQMFRIVQNPQKQRFPFGFWSSEPECPIHLWSCELRSCCAYGWKFLCGSGSAYGFTSASSASLRPSFSEEPILTRKFPSYVLIAAVTTLRTDFAKPPVKTVRLKFTTSAVSNFYHRK